MWVPLHQHSQYSVLDATAAVEEIAKRAASFGMPACALTDHGNMHGAVDFYKACKDAKVKPIIGCEMYVAPESRFEKKKGKGKNAFHLILLAKNKEGYQNLCRLTSLAYLEGFYYHPRIDKELLTKYCGGLICLSACLSSTVAHAALEGTDADLMEEILWHKNLFGDDYYLELQRHTMCDEKVKQLEESWLVTEYEEFVKKQDRLNALLIEKGRSLNIKCLATNDTHYLECGDWKAHEIVLNVQSGEPVEIWEKDHRFRVPNPKRRIYSSRECYFKTPEEMVKLFHDIPEAISNTLEVADKCDFSLDFKTRHYPIYIPPSLEGKKFTQKEQKKEAETYLWRLCEEGIEKRYKEKHFKKIKEKYPDKDPLTVVKERLSWEMEIITSKEMCDYLLIVWDFINWAKNQRIPMGPGRGSGVGSIILYLIGVTDIEPIGLHLFFERFINPERISYPDIDVDICMARRQEVIDYTVNKYGKECVAQIITFGTMKARMTIKDVGRVLSIPLSKVNEIAASVPEDPNMTLSKAIEIDPDLHKMYINDPDAKTIIDIGKRIEGTIRNIGIHAAGIIICRDPLVDHIPICITKDAEMAVTQYSMKPLELVGMLKIDFLGLKTLTSIQLAVDAIEKEKGKKIDWVDLDLTDGPTYEILQQGKTLGIFQLESSGMRELTQQLKPDKFEEVFAIVALYRPGPMDMIPSYIQRKHGKEKIEYDHPLLKSILSETYGIMLYQEQVMHIATELAKYSLGEGDVLRRAMGKKDKAQMEKEREKFIKGAKSNQVPEPIAKAIFDKMEKFAAYGFNKSHAAAYGYLTYVTAYLKANYPMQWMAALLTCDRDDVEKVAKYIRECKALTIPILPPDINVSTKEFVATEQGIRFAIAGIKGIGEGVVDEIIEEREKRGPFKDLYEFFKRMTRVRIGKKTVECLVDAGCFDYTRWTRDELKLSIDVMHETALKEGKEAEQGVLSLFSLMDEKEENRFKIAPIVVKETPKEELLKKEKELLGFFLTSHPLDEYQKILDEKECVMLSEMGLMSLPTVFRTAFVVEGVSIKISNRSQKKFAILTISDGIDSMELPIWSDFFEEKNLILQENRLLFAVLQAEKKEGKIRLSCLWIDDLKTMDEDKFTEANKALKITKNKWSKGMTKETKEEITLKVDLNKVKMSHIIKVKEIMATNPSSNSCKVLFYAGEKLAGELFLGTGVSIDILKKECHFLLESKVFEVV